MNSFTYILALLAALGLIGATLFKMRQNANLTPKIAVLGPQHPPEHISATVQALCNEGSCVADTLKKQLSIEHQELLAQIKGAFEITPDQWNHTQQQIEIAKTNDRLIIKNPIIKHKKADPPIVKKARELLASYHIDPAVVSIKVINNPKTKTNAAAFQGYADGAVIHDLEINIPSISQHAQDVQEAIIRHEIMHLLNYDPLERAYIEVMLLRNGIREEEFMNNEALQNLYKHQEYRADLLAACHGIDTICSLQKDFEHYIKTYPQHQHEQASSTHPTDVQRLQAVTALRGYLEAENKITLA